MQPPPPIIYNNPNNPTDTEVSTNIMNGFKAQAMKALDNPAVTDTQICNLARMRDQGTMPQWAATMQQNIINQVNNQIDNSNLKLRNTLNGTTIFALRRLDGTYPAEFGPNHKMLLSDFVLLQGNDYDNICVFYNLGQINGTNAVKRRTIAAFMGFEDYVQ